MRKGGFRSRTAAGAAKLTLAEFRVVAVRITLAVIVGNGKSRTCSLSRLEPPVASPNTLRGVAPAASGPHIALAA